MSSVVRSSSSSSSSASCSSDDDGSDDDSGSASASASSSSSTTSSRSSQSQSGSSYLFRPHIPFLRQRRGGRGGSGSGSIEMGENHQEQENQDCSPLEKDVEKDHYHNSHHQTHQRQRQRHRGSATASAHKKNCRVASSSSSSSGAAAAAAAWWWSSWWNRNNSNNPFNHQNSSYCLAVALLIWLMVHLPLFEDDNLSSWQQTTTSSRDAAFIRAVQERIHDEKERNPPHEKVRRMILSPRNQNRIQGSSNFWGRDANNNSNNSNNNNNNNSWQKNKQEEHQKEDMEDMPEGCEFPFEWQTTSFPNCNQLHEIDLRQHLKLAKQPPPPPSTSISPNSNDNNNSAAGASASAGAAAADEYYLSSGLWRDVFSMRPADGKTSVVMKLMKPEHPIDTRNWDRHRRDALAMERLTYSPNVVDIYGYCGNTVLIEQAPMGLDVYLEQTQPQPQKAQKRHYQSQASNTTSATATAMTTDLTFHRKLQISLDAARGIAALHSVDIIHADLQTKQFLVDSQGTIKVNDFNRCRFLPRKKNDSSTSLESASSSASSSSFLEICPIRIPSSPGLWRSPEEYSGKPLVAAMDVYSLGNVLHQILMGERPFQSAGAKMLKRNVRLGVHPEINVTTIDHGGASSSSAISRLAILIQLCLERDLEKRISASDLVRELELLLAEEEGRVVVSSVSTTS